MLPRLRDVLTSSARPVLVEVLDDGPVDSMDAEELSSSCRTAGAAGLLLPASLLGPVAAEQALADGSFPGPLPLVFDLRSSDLNELPGGSDCPDLASLHRAGASAVAVLGAALLVGGAVAAADAVASAQLAGLEVVVLVGSATDGAAAEAAGACAVVYDHSLSAEASAMPPGPAGEGESQGEGEGGAVRLDSWEGDEDGLYELREQGAGAPPLAWLGSGAGPGST